MWYNITMQLHHKVNLLGQILIGKFIILIGIIIIVVFITFVKCTIVFTQILGLGARSSVANFWPQLDNCGGGSQRDEGVGSVNSDLTEVNIMDKWMSKKIRGNF